MTDERGELFSMLLRLHPKESGVVSLSSGPHIQAAFLDMVRQGDPSLADCLHRPNQRRPYTLSLLQGFNHLTPTELASVTNKNQLIEVKPGQVYWLRITMLDATIFSSFAHYLIANPRSLNVRIGSAHFEISRLITTQHEHSTDQSWVAYSSFSELYILQAVSKQYHFEFASPTAFSMGQKAWGKLLKLFPEPADVFASLAAQWELFAPTHLRLSTHNLTPQAIAAWCTDNIVVTNYDLTTRYLPSQKFGQTGFMGTVTYEVKGHREAAEAHWLTPLARFALFSGVGYKTAMGMGQVRCTTKPIISSSFEEEQEQNL